MVCSLQKFLPSGDDGDNGMMNLGSLTVLFRMSGVCESWALEDLVQMNDQDMNTLLTYYASGEIPSFSDIRASVGPQ